MTVLTSLPPWLKQHIKAPYPSLRTWLASCREKLETLTAKDPAAPKNARRAAKIDCTCDDCAELKRFLEDPSETVHRFRVRQDRRQHLADRIRSSHSDLDLVTDKRGSPQTLVCTKNWASFQKRT